jgi:uncharacterized protein (DUF433 family)
VRFVPAVTGSSPARHNQQQAFPSLPTVEFGVSREKRMQSPLTRVMVFCMERITINPEQCGGRPCIRGMRIRVKDVLDMLAGGATAEEILADYPDLEVEDIRACLAYASRYLDHSVLVAA